MNKLSIKDSRLHIPFIVEASRVARSSPCLSGKRCGSLIVKDQFVIGRANNAPPSCIVLDNCQQLSRKSNFKSDPSCCLHAEQRALMKALCHHPTHLQGSSLYYARIDEHGLLVYSRTPRCTICSKLILDMGISFCYMLHSFGLTVYSALDFNTYAFNSS
jgi:deoxycytidylate deaminase